MIFLMSSHHPAIRVRNLGKKYTIDGQQKNYLPLRDAIVNSVKAPFVCYEEIWHIMRSEFLQVSDINA